VSVPADSPPKIGDRACEPGATISAVWLTMNPNLGASARALQDWVLLGKNAGLSISVVLQHDGDLRRWLQETCVPHVQDPMYWPDRRRVLLSALHALKLKRWMKKRRVELIHCYEHDLYPFAAALRWLTSLPLVCHIHFAPDRGFASWAFGGSKRPDAVIWTSRQQQEDCADVMAGLVPSNRQHVIPLGIDVSRFGSHLEERAQFRQRLGIGPDTIVVGMACALRARKRIDDFLELMRVVHGQYTNVVGVLAGGEVPGDEAYAREVIPRINALEATGAIRWVGHLEPVEPFLQATDIFVSTSEYETFGMSVLEAMACGKAVAAYRGGSVYEVVAGTGLIAETGDVAGLLSAVQSLVASSDLRRDFGIAAKRRVVTAYDPRQSLVQLKHVYESIL
jgi:glycosyltransferase involved in cell wall biosynthesis